MNILQLVKRRKTEGVKSSKDLCEYFINKSNSIDDDLIAYNLLLEYLIDGNYDLLDKLIDLNKSKINDENLLFLYLLSFSINNNYEKELEKEILNKEPEIKKLYYYKPYFDYDVNKKIDFYVNLSTKIKIDKLKLFFLKKAQRFSDNYPAYLIGNYYVEKEDFVKANEYFKLAAVNGNKEAGLMLIDKCSDNKEKIFYYNKIVQKDDKDIILMYIDSLMKENEFHKAYMYLLDNVKSSSMFRYKLAKFYEEGLYVEKNPLFAYYLYLSCLDINDSVKRVKELKLDLITRYSIIADELLEPIIRKEEKNIKRKKEKDDREKEYIKCIENEFKNKVILRNPEEELKKAQLYKTSSDYKYEYDKKDSLYRKALKEEKIYKKIEYLEKAAKENHSLAMLALYELYSDIDEELSLSWLKKASYYNKEAERIYKEQQKNSKIIEKTEKENAAKEFKNDLDKLKECIKSANKGDQLAKDLIEYCFGKGTIIKKVLKVFEDEMLEKNSYAILFLHNYYLNDGNDKELAKEYLIKGCELNNADSIMLYCNKYGVSQSFCLDHPKAAEKILQFDTDDYHVVHGQATILINKNFKSDNFSYNPKLAFEKYKFLESKYGIDKFSLASEIARCYEHGIGVDFNIEEAIKYYKIGKPYYAKELEEIIKEKGLKMSLVTQEDLKAPYIVNVVKPKVDEVVKTDEIKIEIEEETKEEINSLVEDEFKTEVCEVFIVDKTLKVKEDNSKTINKIEEQINSKPIVSALPKSQIKETTPKIISNEIKPQKLNKPVNSNLVEKNESKQVQPKPKEIISDDDPYFKELTYYTKSDVGYREARRIALLRRRLDYPIPPTMKPEYDKYGIRHSKREREKEFIKELDARKEKIEEYYERLYSRENLIQKNHNEYRGRVWGTKDTSKILTSSEFVKLCEREYNSKVKSYNEEDLISIKVDSKKFANSEGGVVNFKDCVESMFACVPIYTKELTILIKGTVTYRMDYSDPLADEMIAFEGSDLAKKATWSEYSKLEAVASRHHDYQYIHNVDAANRGRKIQAQNKREAEIKQLIINLYEKHDVFAGLTVESPKGKKQYFEGYVKKIKFVFKWKYKN